MRKYFELNKNKNKQTKTPGYLKHTKSNMAPMKLPIRQLTV